MANREENLKKINAELEKMSDEDLEKIAGGITGENADDKDLIRNNLVSETFEEELKQVFVENADEKNLLKKDLPVKHNGLIPDW